MVNSTRTKQYWKTESQTTCNLLLVYGFEANSTSTAGDERSYVEPGQAASRYAQGTLVFSASTFLQAEDTPKPVYRSDLAEIILLLVQVRGDVVAQECEEGGNGEGFVAVAEDFKVDGVFVVEV